MKAVVATFNQEKALLRDCTTSPINRFAALVNTNPECVLMMSFRHIYCACLWAAAGVGSLVVGWGNVWGGHIYVM